MVKKKEQENDNLTPWDKYLQKKKDKQSKKREEMQSKKERHVAEDNSHDGSESDEYIPAGIDMDDPYFQQELGEMDSGSTGTKS